MNNNYQSNSAKKQRPLSSKIKQKKNPQFYLNFQNNEDQILLKGKNQNQSISRNSKNENRSQFNESEELNQESLNDMYSTIQKDWYDLGITDNYQFQFHNSIKNLNEEQIKSIFFNEKYNLDRFRDIIIKLRNAIKSRDNNINNLRKDVIALSKEQNKFGKEEDEKFKRNRETIILQIIGLIKSLRINSINVVEYFLKLRELSTYCRIKGKIDMKLINSDIIVYNGDYLKKMKTDMDFLKQSKHMKKYFDMNNGEIDAFLTNFDSRPSNNLNYIKFNSNKAKIPVSQDVKNSIMKCRYILLQEEIFDKMKNGGFDRDNSINDYTYNTNRNTFSNMNALNNNRYDIPKIRFFNGSKDEQKEYPNILDVNNNVNNKMSKIRSNNSSGRILNNSKEKDIQERKSLEYLRLNMGNEYNNLFYNERFNNKNNPMSTTYENSFRRQFLGGNKIRIIREERKKDRIQLGLSNEFLMKKDPLSEENKELNRQLNDVCENNEILKEETEDLHNKIREIERINIENEKKAKKKEKEQQIFCKKLSNNIDELTLEKKDLGEKLRANKNLMEKTNKENSEKIKNLNNNMQKQKEQYENNINDLNSQIEQLIKEKDSLINQKEQLLKEKEELLINKQNLEENIMQLNLQISEYKLEVENYKNTVNENFQKIEEMDKKINELTNSLTTLQNEKNQLENETSQKISELSNKITEMESTIQNNQEIITKLENANNQLNIEKEELFKSDTEAKKQINNLNEELSNLNIQINDKDMLINTLQSKLSDYDVIKKENGQMKIKINNQEKEITNLKEKLKKLTPNYKCDYYRGNLFNFISSISNKLSLDKIPDYLKYSFNLQENEVFEESSYLKGVYPKIIISTLEDSDEISAFCSVYYENYGYVGDPLVLRIGVLFSIEDNWEVQIKNIINFIKENIFFDELKYIINYIKNPEDGKLKMDQRIKLFFKEEIKASWKNVTNHSNGTRTQEVCIVKEGDYFNKDINITNNNQFFGLKSLSVVSLYENNEFAGVITENPEDELKRKYSKIYLNKYINHYPIFLLLANNPKYKMIFENEEYKKLYEIPKCKEEEEYLNPKTQIKELTKMEFNLNNTSNLQQYMNTFNINNLLCEEVFDKLQSNIDIFSINYLTMEINLSTPTNFCLNFENYIYNRISSKRIEVLRDPESKNFFYLIPTNNEAIFIFISQIGPRLKEYLLDNSKNLYQALTELHPKLTNQLVQFSSLNLSSFDQKNIEKVIYIPSFKIDSHLFSFSVKDIKEKGTLTEIETNKEKNLGSIDECFTLSFEGDKNLKDSFSIIPVEDKKLNMVIRESFLFGIFNINIIENSPLQLYYVTKDHWVYAN